MDEQGSDLPLNVRPFLSTRENIAQQCIWIEYSSSCSWSCISCNRL